MTHQLLEHTILLSAVLWIFDVPRNALAFILMAFQRLMLSHENTPLSKTAYSVVIPVLNESGGIVKAVRMLKMQTVLPAQIIVVNDGSSDESLTLIRHLKRRGEIDIVIDNPQRLGVSGACNKALLHVSEPHVLFLDCDTFLATDACEQLLLKLERGGDAVSGNIALSNAETSVWTGLQQIEYMTGIDLGRSFAERFHAISCMSGAMMMFKTSVLKHVGGFAAGSGQDLEITLRLRRHGYRIRFASLAWSYTKGPENLTALIKQRLRWDRDAIRIHIFQYHQLFKSDHRESLGNTLQRYDFLIFTLIPTLLVPAMFIEFWLIAPDERWMVMLWIYGLLVVNSLFSLTWAFLAQRGKTSGWSILLIPLHPLYQGILMGVVRLYAYLTETIGRSSRHDHFVPERIRKVLYAQR